MSGMPHSKGAAALFLFVGTAFAQAQHDPVAAIAAQVEALKVFGAMDGVWRGPAWTLGHAGDFAFRPTDDGYAWEIPAGPNATIRYTATIRDGTLKEVGDRVVADRPPLRIFEMELKRIGVTGWPAENPVPSK